jgi:F-type H+-transporting ATPase subunit b
MDLVTPGLGLLFWQLVTFLLVLFVLSRFAWKPILTSIKEREAGIDASLAEAKQARMEMGNVKASNENMLREARIEQERIIREAQLTATAIIAEAQEKARTEGARLVEDARIVIRTEKANSITEIRAQVAQLSLSIAEKILKQELTNDTAQHQLIERYMAESGGLN